MEINGFKVEEFNIYKIPTKATTHTCPKCSHARKKKNDKCMSVFWNTGLGQCNHCGETIQLHTYSKKNQEVIYIKPKLSIVKSNLSDALIKYIGDTRRIDLKSLEALKVREQKEWMPQTKKEENCICFDYYLNSEVVNVKYRDGKKNFKLYKGAERIFYNLDSIRTNKECVIVEGEFDVLAFHTAGVSNVVSVPNGFNLKGDNVNLDYLDNYLEYFDNKKVIYLAVDNDDAGRKGQAELIRRLGAENCKTIDFKDCKDANDYLIKYGKSELKSTLKNAKDVKIEGVFFAEDVKKSMWNGYRNGQKRGTTTYVEDLDKAWTWRSGEVNMWYGYQNEGKSLMLNQLCAIRAYWEDAKVGIFSPENMPLDDFYNDIIESFIGKSCDPYYQNNYMGEYEYDAGLKFVNDNFFLIYPEKNFTLDSIFKRAKYLVKKKGIRTLIIDPYNTVEHKMKSGEREDLYISRFMAKLKRFSVENDLSTNLVAHQLTARANPNDGGRYFKPDPNRIKGGGTFADKADNCLFVWRPNRALDFKDSNVVVGSQKIKKQKLVGIPQDVDGVDFNIRENRYYFNGISPFTKIDEHRTGTKKEVYQIPVMNPQDAFIESEIPF